ncbi:MAG: YigZ family protein [Hespellia sp.]|nr:YigZ family protein [Hespellia sp.]
MLTEYRAVVQNGIGEIIEKKSRFIANVISIATEEEAAMQIEKIKKQYWDARHNCWAYILGEDQPLERFSDDGEPGGTAGKPILEVIRGEELRNVLIVVTRYFGGTLLGTGGLVRAYTGASKAGLANSEIVTRMYGYRLEIQTDYTGLGKIQYILGSRGIAIAATDYTEAVRIEILVKKEDEKQLIAELTEGTNGQAKIERAGECWIDVNIKRIPH